MVRDRGPRQAAAGFSFLDNKMLDWLKHRSLEFKVGSRQILTGFEQILTGRDCEKKGETGRWQEMAGLGRIWQGKGE